MRNKLKLKRDYNSLKRIILESKYYIFQLLLLAFLKEQSWIFDMINNILIEIMASVAEEERMKIKQRQTKGIETAEKTAEIYGNLKFSYLIIFQKLR